MRPSYKPCGWYFASNRANVTQGPIRGMSGVWRGESGDWIWTPWDNGAMAGLWRRADAPRFYTVSETGSTITLVEITAGVTTTYNAVEQGERFVVFANADRGRIAFRDEDGGLALTIEPKDGIAERHRLSLQI